LVAGNGGMMADLSPPTELLPRVRWTFVGIALLSLVAALMVVATNSGAPRLERLLAAAGTPSEQAQIAARTREGDPAPKPVRGPRERGRVSP